MLELKQYGLDAHDKRSFICNNTSVPLTSTVDGVTLIYEKILNLLSQEKGSLFYDRSVGLADIEDWIFETDSDDAIKHLKMMIMRELQKLDDTFTVSDIKITRHTINNDIMYDVDIQIKVNNQIYRQTIRFTNNGITEVNSNAI